MKRVRTIGPALLLTLIAAGAMAVEQADPGAVPPAQPAASDVTPPAAAGQPPATTPPAASAAPLPPPTGQPGAVHAGGSGNVSIGLGGGGGGLDSDSAKVVLVVLAVTAAYVIPIMADRSPDFVGWGAPTAHQPQRTAERAVGADLLAAWQHDRDAGTVHRWFRGELSTRWRVGAMVAADRIDSDDRHQLLTQADLTLRFAHGHGWAFSTGLGGRWRQDGAVRDGGIDYIYGVETWPIQPVVLRGQVAFGRLGGDNVTDAWIHLGAGWRYGEVFVGERYLRIGEVMLRGPLLGVGLHW